MSIDRLTDADLLAILGNPADESADGDFACWKLQGHWSGSYVVYYEPARNGRPHRVTVAYCTFIQNKGMCENYLCDLETKEDLSRFMSLLVERDA